jgi:SAM-dependent methyltransferase
MSTTAAPRFEFGANWRRFLRVLDEDRIREAERSLEGLFGPGTIEGRSFLDAGSGSGLFSLAAVRLGAASVRAFDYDPESVACTAELRERYFPQDPRWSVERGDVLDPSFIGELGVFDVVYSWGVLHHTGRMWAAMDNVGRTVAPGGLLCVAIYNDQGRRSRIWRRIKQAYNRLPRPLRPLVLVPVAGAIELRQIAHHLRHGELRAYAEGWTRYERDTRGMSRWRDIVDWIGGYPYEVATPAAVQRFYEARGFELSRLVAAEGWGCNQFVLRRSG